MRPLPRAASVRLIVAPPDTLPDLALTGFVAATDTLRAIADRLAAKGKWPLPESVTQPCEQTVQSP